jgi:TPR repeat protein
MQAKMIMSYPGSLGPYVPYDVPKAAELLKFVCEEKEDSVSCFTLATMLLRGNKVDSEGDNVTPMEARGETALQKRTNEANREKLKSNKRTSLPRDPIFAQQSQGIDEGIEKDEEKTIEYQQKTEELVKRFGGFGIGGMSKNRVNVKSILSIQQ